MGIITLEHMDELYWLGRYSERVYTTIRLYFTSYDKLIDFSEFSYADFCRQIEIPDVYGSAEEFRTRYAFDETDVNSIISNLNRAYDNAIILREEIGSETLSYIQLALYAMQKAKVSHAPLIELQRVIDNILAFWGIADDSIDSEQVRNIIKAGKRVERIDLYARLKISRTELLREVHRLIPRIARCGISYRKSNLEKIEALAMQDSIDYGQIVGLIEAVLEG